MRWPCMGAGWFLNPLLRTIHFTFRVTVVTNVSNTYTTKFDRYQKSRSYQLHSSAFCDSRNVTRVEVLHANFIKNGSLQNASVGNHLLSLYGKCQNLYNADKLFDEILDKDVRSWTILISGFGRNGSYYTVLDLFRRMQAEGFCPNQFTLSTVLTCCSSLYELRYGKGVHGWILRNGIGLDVVLENSILDLYVKCGAFDYSNRVFKSMEAKDVVSWNIMIGGLLHIGDVGKSLELFWNLNFKDVATWNTTIDGLMRNGFEQIALELLYKMVENGSVFNAVTFSIALNLVAHLSILELGKQIHGQCLRLGIHDNGFIRNSLLDLYCKCGKMEEASIIFRKMPVYISCDNSMAEFVSWSSMVSGYVRNGDYKYALQTFSFMIRKCVEVDRFTLTSIVSACANIGASEFGRQIHAYLQKIGYKIDAHLGSSLVDMYAKCGSLNDAQMIFKQIDDPNVVLWTSMISGCALHGQGREALRLFKCSMNGGITPNEITFVAVLTACSHAGFVEEGRKYFDLMQKVCGIKPGVEHYVCMVDLYGRAGCLNETKDFILKNGISNMSAVWKSFLSSCRLHQNVDMAKWVSKRLLELEPSDPGSYVLLSNMFASEHGWEEAAKVRNLMQQKNMNKFPGQSWIQHDRESGIHFSHGG